VVSATTIASTACDTKVNGEINAAVVGLAPPFTGYTFNFEKVADGTVWNSASSNLTGLAPGDYNITVTQDATACTSASLTVNISDNRILPTATFIIDDQIACDNNFTGKITAVPGSATVSDYTYNWFVNNFLGLPVSPDVASSGEIISGQDQGTYALRLTSLITECSADFFPTINSGIVIPVVSATTIASTACDTKVNGEINAAVVGLAPPFTGYTFNFEKVADGTVWNSASSNLTGLAPGDYNVTVTQDATACTSGLLSVRVQDNSITPNPQIAVVNNSSCDGNNPNGSLEVKAILNGVDPLSDYYFSWFIGNSLGTQLTSPLVNFPNVSDSALVTRVSEGTYSLVVTNSNTMCRNEVFVQVNKISVFPMVSVTVTDATRCADPFLSAAVATVTDAISSTHSFEWTYLDGGPTILPVTTGAITDLTDSDGLVLTPGNYRLVVTNEYNCSTLPVLFEIKGTNYTPAFTLNALPNTSCDPVRPEGILVASRNDDSYTVNSYEWFRNNLNGTLLATTTGNDSIYTGLPSATYAVRVTDDATMCSSVEYSNIIDLSAAGPIIDNRLITGLTSCISKNGELGFGLSPLEQLPPANTANRGYTFYIENNITLADTTAVGVVKLSTDPSGATPDEVLFTGLASGNWTAIVVDNFTHCVSWPLTVNLPEAPGVVIQKLAETLPADCDPASTGEVQFGAGSANNADPTGLGFDFNWEYYGVQFSVLTDNNPGVVEPAGTDDFKELRSGLRAGYYIVSVLDKFSGCTASDTFYIPVLDAPPIVSADPLDAVNCVPGNGEIEFEVKDTGSSGPSNAYDVILFKGPLAISGEEIAQLTLAGYDTKYKLGSNEPGDYNVDLPPGQYTIVTVENSTPNRCLSDPFVVSIGLDVPLPTIVTSINPDFSCNINGTGGIEAISTGADSDTNFDYYWYAGTDTLDNGSAISNSPILTNQTAGAYTVKVIDRDGQSNGCRYKKVVNLTKSLVPRAITAVTTNNTDCVPFNGETYIDEVLENNVLAALGDYDSWTIFDKDYNDITALNSGSGLMTSPWNTLAPGNYYLTGEHISTSCPTDNLRVTIQDLSTKPDINITILSQDFACDPSVSSGELRADIGGIMDEAEYTYIWYQGTTAGTPVSNPSPASYIASSLSANGSSATLHD
jgi:large repetitive protein